MSFIGHAASGTYVPTSGTLVATAAVELPVAAGKWLLGGLATTATGSAPGPLAVTDSKGNTYTVRESPIRGTTVAVFAFDCEITTPLTTSDTITFTLSGHTANQFDYIVDLWDEIDAFDASTSTNGSSSAPSVGPVTVAGGVAVSYFGTAVHTFTPGADWTLSDVQASTTRQLSAQYMTGTTAGALTATAGIDSQDVYAAAVVAYTPTATPPPTEIPTRVGTVAKQAQTVNTTSFTMTLTGPAAVGDRLIGALVTSAGATVDTLTVTDSAGNTWTVREPGLDAGKLEAFIFDADITDALATGDGITFTLTAARFYWTGIIDRWTNIDDFDTGTTRSSDTAGTALSVGPVTAAGGIAVAAFGYGAGRLVSAASGWSLDAPVSTAGGTFDKSLTLAYSLIPAGAVTAAATSDTSVPNYVAALATYGGSTDAPPAYESALVDGEWVPCTTFALVDGEWV